MWENPEKGKGEGGGRDSVFEEVTGDLLEEKVIQFSWSHGAGVGGGGWSPSGREVSTIKGREGAVLCFWGKSSSDRKKGSQGKECRERKENRGKDVGI